MLFSQLLLVAANQGGGAAGETVGPDLISNGGFADGTDWLLEEGDLPATISGGVLQGGGEGGNSQGRQLVTLTNGATYRVTYTIVAISTSNVNCLVGGTFGTQRTTAGTYIEDVVAGVDDYFAIEFGENDATVDNVSLNLIT